MATEIVVVTAPGCHQCRLMKPDLEAVAAAHEGVVGYRELDVASHLEEARALGVRATPTLLVFTDGVEVTRSVGRLSRNSLEDVFGSAVHDETPGRIPGDASNAVLRVVAGIVVLALGLWVGEWILSAAGLAVSAWGLWSYRGRWRAR